MKKLKNCIKCKLGIDIKKDDFLELKEFNKGKYYNSVFWHKDCWKEFFSSKAQQKELLDKAKESFGKVSTLVGIGNEGGIL